MTDAQFGTAHIKAVKPDRVRRALDKGSVAIVAGFQGVNEGGDATTLGRGGSDTSAVALAVALDADICEIYTDVDGVFTADPRIVPTAVAFPSSTTNRCWKCRPAVPRCWHCVAWNTRNDSACRCMCAAPSPTVAAR